MGASVIHSKAKGIRLSDYFPKAIFWDVDLDLLDYKEDADFVIERILNWGWVGNVWDRLDELYPKKAIVYYCKNSSEIRGNEKIEVIAERYGLKPGDFKGYIPNIDDHDRKWSIGKAS